MTTNGRATSSGNPPADDHWDGSAPQPINPETGQHKDYWVLPEAERAKGFVRPIRSAYIHVRTPRPAHPLRDLTYEEKIQYANANYAKFEIYPESESPKTGRFWTQAELDRKACYVVTRMSASIAETYARNPKYYDSTFCVGCRLHFSVEEFDWEGGSVLGS